MTSFALEITTTALCDLACTYCFEGEKTDSTRLSNTEVITSNIKKLLDTDYFQNEVNEFIVTFWGGEPTLNYKLINLLISSLLELEVKQTISFMIYTNGYNRKHLESILNHLKNLGKEHLLNLQISYDGKIINDKYRLTKTKQSTRDDVLSNFFYVAKNYSIGQLHLKATIPLDMTNTILDNWKEFYQLNHLLKLQDIKALNVGVEYSPTLDYINLLPPLEKIKVAKEFEDNLTIIAKLEYEYFLAYGKFLMTWFSGKEMRNNCTAGYNLINLNVDGTINYCHGSLYIKDKKDLQIKDLTFTSELGNEEIQRIIDFILGFKTKAEDYFKYNQDCIQCEATYCTVCPAMLYSLNKQKYEYSSQDENLYHNNSEFLNCQFFKAFGKVDRALQKLIKTEGNKNG